MRGRARRKVRVRGRVGPGVRGRGRGRVDAGEGHVGDALLGLDVLLQLLVPGEG